MFQLHFHNYPQYFAWMRQHISGLTPAPWTLAGLSMLLKFQRSGRYYSAVVLAASRQFLLRLAQPGVLTGSPPRLPRTSLGTSGTLSPPVFRNPVQPRSFAIVEAITLPSWFCPPCPPPAPVRLHSKPAPRILGTVFRFGLPGSGCAHSRQPQDGQRYHFREFWIRKLSVFYITGHYNQAER